MDSGFYRGARLDFRSFVADIVRKSGRPLPLLERLTMGVT